MKRLIYLLVVVLFISCEKSENAKSWNVMYEVVCESDGGLFNAFYVDENGESQAVVENIYVPNVVWGQTPWTYSMTIPKSAHEAKHLFLSMRNTLSTPTIVYPFYTIRIYVNDEIVAEKSGQFWTGLQIAYDLK